MTYAAPFSRHEIASSSKPLAKAQDGANMRKNPANSDEHARTSRKWFANLLRRAFPANSEAELAERAAPVLGVSTRQVRNWLREDHDASLRYVTAVMMIAGAEVVFSRMESRQP
ncbi:hypothetical protein GQY15_17700 [Rhodobacter sphaeroides]|uniref:hypothetical protein n=1 Tax=Cereibacter sphaeroides TaxID=1063 RepID=UPI0013229F65|nr:hypothetical protein [Cereibacter sphaeroides]